jgi:hypothetical protein
LQVLAAHATGATAVQAADEVADRLRRQLRRVVDADVAQRDEPAGIEVALAALPVAGQHRPEAKLKPPEEPFGAVPTWTIRWRRWKRSPSSSTSGSWCFVDDVAMRIPELQGPTHPAAAVGTGLKT